MKKIKALLAAFRQVPVLFRLVYQTDKPYLFFMLFETVAFALIPYPATLLVKYAFDALENGIPFSRFAAICSALILTGFVLSVLKSYFNRIRPGRTSLVVGKLYSAFHKKSMEMDYELLAEKETQELQNFAGRFISRMLSNTVWNFVSLFSSVVAFLISCLMISYVDALLILVILAGLMLDSLLAACLIPVRTKLNTAIMEIDRRLKYFDETATNDTAAKDIRLFHLSLPLRQRMEGYAQNKQHLESRKEFYSNLQGILSNLLSHGVDFAVYAILGYSVLKNTLSLGSFSLAVSNILLFRTYFAKISGVLVGYSETAKYLEYYNKFMAIESKFRKTGHMLPLLSETEPFTIEFRDVSFRYPGQNEYVLRHFNLIIHSGEKIAIIGENGAGKSTFVKLLMRLYDPTEGEVLVNGVNILNYDYDQYLSLFAPVFQDYKLFAFTIGENISSFDEAELHEISSAAEKAGIAQRIEQSEAGYDTYFTKQFDEAGVEFSGGEQQKIALARACFKNNAKITILDEPTSALDPRAEHQLYERFSKLIGNNTAFFISHRLASAIFCDKVLVIKDQSVFEYGSHDELIAKKGYYHELYHMQSDYYV